MDEPTRRAVARMRERLTGEPKPGRSRKRHRRPRLAFPRIQWSLLYCRRCLLAAAYGGRCRWHSYP